MMSEMMMMMQMLGIKDLLTLSIEEMFGCETSDKLKQTETWNTSIKIEDVYSVSKSSFMDGTHDDSEYITMVEDQQENEDCGPVPPIDIEHCSVVKVNKKLGDIGGGRSDGQGQSDEVDDYVNVPT